MDSREPRFFSIIIPLYNRPQEIAELLASLTRQKYQKFEVIVVDDGSLPPAADVVNAYAEKLELHYIYQENKGQGFARNLGFQQARGDYFVVFDSDCLIPEDYLQVVDRALQIQWLDAYGGPDRDHPSFTPFQKAINYAMTSPLSTGGIRGNKRHLGTFHPRSFNMGISRQTWEKTDGFRWTNQSEDMELSIRMQGMGLRVGLIAGAAVYHKRRVNLLQFFKQTHSFGQGRIRLFRHFRSELKAVHCLPALFTFGLLIALLTFNGFILSIYLGYFVLLFFHALFQTRNIKVAMLSVIAVITQFVAYGSGFLKSLIYTSNSNPS